MNAHEACGVERGLQARDRLLFEVRFSGRVERHVVVLRLYVVQLIERNHVYAGAILYHNALRPFRGTARGGHLHRETPLAKPRRGAFQVPLRTAPH